MPNTILWIVHATLCNIAGHGSEVLQKSTGFDTEDFCVDAFYWFDKRKAQSERGFLRCSAVSVTVTQCVVAKLREGCIHKLQGIQCR